MMQPHPTFWVQHQPQQLDDFDLKNYEAVILRVVLNFFRHSFRVYLRRPAFAGRDDL
jgi:hypothetical protein